MSIQLLQIKMIKVYLRLNDLFHSNSWWIHERSFKYSFVVKLAVQSFLEAKIQKNIYLKTNNYCSIISLS